MQWSKEDERKLAEFIRSENIRQVRQNMKRQDRSGLLRRRQSIQLGRFDFSPVQVNNAHAEQGAEHTSDRPPAFWTPIVVLVVILAILQLWSEP
jgi:hypothetical protein